MSSASRIHSGTEHNLLFGVLALQADLIDSTQFADACAAWAARKDTPLADILLERGWLSRDRRALVDQLLEIKLNKHNGDAHAGLTEVATPHVRQSLTAVDDLDVRQSITAAMTPPTPGHVLLTTTDFIPESRERYTLSRLHAEGGIGRVWLARDASLGRDVALKELRPERVGHPSVWARFLREAQITGQLEHPSIVPIYELGTQPGDRAPFYTMRFVRGRTLHEALKAYHETPARAQDGTLHLRELLGAFIGVCNAVAYAHSRGVLHRDLKPQNVVLGDYGEVIVLDWGLARVVQQPDGPAGASLQIPADDPSDVTIEGQVMGTPAYMAPEQAEGRLEELGPLTDVYGLGAILYAILCGEPPFADAELIEILRRVVHQAPAPPSSLVPGVPPALDAVCLKALAKKPDERYGSAKALAGEVERWLAGEPVAAYPDPLLTRLFRWVRRHRQLVTAGVAAALVALVGLAAVLAEQARSNRELAKANLRLAGANVREQERFDLAQDAIRVFHTGVSEDLLLRQDQFKGLRDRLLHAAVDFYGKLEHMLEGQSDPRSRRALAAAYHQLGLLTEKIGSRPEALKVLRQELALRRELSREEKTDLQVQIDLGTSLMSVGVLEQRTGDSKGALASFREGRALADILVARGNPPAECLSLQARSQHNIGWSLSQAGANEEALAAYQMARPLLQRLADAYPDVAEYQFTLAVSWNNIGWMLAGTGKPADALDAYNKSRSVHERLAKAQPTNTAYQYERAGNLNNTGVVLSDTGKLEEALEAHQNALQIQQEIVRANPAITLFQRTLAESFYNLGILMSRMGKPKEGADSSARAAALLQRLYVENPTDAGIERVLSSCHNNGAAMLVQIGKLAAALEEYNEALKIRERLAVANPAFTGYQSDIAESRIGVGQLRFDLGQPKDALSEYNKAQAILQKIVEADRSADAAKDLLATALSASADVLCAAGQLDQASAVYDRAMALREDLFKENPTFLQYRIGLATSLVGRATVQRAAGRFADAARSCGRAGELLDAYPARSLEDLVSLAARQALLAGVAGETNSGVPGAQRQPAAEKAVALLRTATAAGYANAGRIRNTRSFEALRSHPDFQKLLTEMESRGITKKPIRGGS